MKIRIDEIFFNEKKRIRNDNGDIAELSRSLSKYGLLQPVIIDTDFKLIAGFRRLLAAKSLGWTYIETQIVDPKDKLTELEIEMEENLTRKEFSYDEVDYAFEMKGKLQYPGLFRKIGNFFKKMFGKKI